MNNRTLIVALSAGAALLVDSGCSGSDGSIQVNPAPPAVPDTPDEAEPKPDPEPAPAGLPTWDSVGSGHPEGATNPPRPVLVVDPDGRCFKDWTSGMMAPTPETEDRVQSCPDDAACGTQVQCPPKAEELLAAYTEAQKGKDPADE